MPDLGSPASLTAPPATRLPATGRHGWLPRAVGAGLAIMVTGLLGHWTLASSTALPWLLASMGASAVLIFVLPASPLAQPWPVVGGHVIAASTGMVMHALIPLPWLAAALAVGCAIALMSLARCLHPPAGGTALLTALPAPAVAAAGPAFLLMPLLLNVTVLLAAGFTWNRLTGHSYPHRSAPIPIPHSWIGHIEDQDVDAVLADWDELLDISRDDLLALIHAVETKVRDRAGIR